MYLRYFGIRIFAVQNPRIRKNEFRLASLIHTLLEGITFHQKWFIPNISL